MIRAREPTRARGVPKKLPHCTNALPRLFERLGRGVMVQGWLSGMAIRAFVEQRLAGVHARGISGATDLTVASPGHHDGCEDGLYPAAAFTAFHAHHVVLSTDATLDRPRAECQETA